MTAWEDTSAYVTAQASQSPFTWKLRLASVTLMVTRWVSGAPEEWFLLSPELGVSRHSLLCTGSAEEARRTATARALQLVRRRLHDLHTAEQELELLLRR